MESKGQFASVAPHCKCNIPTFIKGILPYTNLGADLDPLDYGSKDEGGQIQPIHTEAPLYLHTYHNMRKQSKQLRNKKVPLRISW